MLLVLLVAALYLEDTNIIKRKRISPLINKLQVKVYDDKHLQQKKIIVDITFIGGISKIRLGLNCVC